MDIVSEIKKFFKGEVTVNEADLERYSRDASLFKVRPALVVYPRDAEDIKKLVAFVAENKPQHANLSLTVRSGGTDMTGGPLSESVVVDVSRHLNKIIEIGSDYAVAEPGLFYRDFERETLQKNLLLPSYPASREMCTLGGMVANNAGGEKTLKYGKTQDYVKELKMILRDGEEYVFKPIALQDLSAKTALDTLEGDIYRRVGDLVIGNKEIIEKSRPMVSKNSSGYNLWEVIDKKNQIFDLTKLIVGSQGTLGIITQARFSLIKPKPHSRLLVIFLRDVSILAAVIRKILGFEPESFESYDDHTFKVAVKFFPEIARRLKGGLIKLAISFLPEFWMIFMKGVPKLVLLAEFTGDTAEEAVDKAVGAERALSGFALETRVTASQYDADKYWTIRRESFNFLRKKAKNLRAAPFIDDVIVSPEYLPDFLPRLYAVLDKYSIIYTVAGHVGDGNFHIIPLMDFSDKKSKEIVALLAREVYGLVVEFKGSITAEHNDGLIRGPYLKQAFGEEVYGLFEEVRKIFDPNDVFNPGKKVGASLEYALDHIDVS